MNYKHLSLAINNLNYFKTFCLLEQETLEALNDSSISDLEKKSVLLRFLNLFKVNAPYTAKESINFGFQLSAFHLYFFSTYNRQSFTSWHNILMSQFCKMLVTENTSIKPSYLFLNCSDVKSSLNDFVHYYSLKLKDDYFINKNNLNSLLPELLDVLSVEFYKKDPKLITPIFILLENPINADKNIELIYKLSSNQFSCDPSKIKKFLIIGYVKKIIQLDCLVLPYYGNCRTNKSHQKIKSLFNRSGITVDPVCFFDNLSSQLLDINYFKNWLNNVLDKSIYRLQNNFEKSFLENEIITLKNVLNSKPLVLESFNVDIQESINHSFSIFKNKTYNFDYEKIIINYIIDIQKEINLLELPGTLNRVSKSFYTRLDRVFKALIDNLDDSNKMPLFMQSFQEFQECALDYIRLHPEKNIQTYASHVDKCIKEKCGLTPLIISQTYGMSVFVKVVKSLLENNNENLTMNLQIVGNSYFEVLSSFCETNNSSLSIAKVPYFSKLKFDSDILITDIHPNNAVQSEIKSNNIASYLNLRCKNSKPLSLLLDITLNHINDLEVVNLINSIKPFIENGNLNLVLVKSNSKLDQLGTDILNMGTCIVLNNHSNWFNFNTFIQNEISTVDDVTQKFFGLASSTASISLYKDKLNSNKKLFTKILDYFEQENDCIKHLEDDSDENSVYVSLICESPDIAEKVIQGLKLLSNKFRLPLTQRMSIGFNMASVNDCLHTIRFCLGLESDKQIVMYAQFVRYLNDVLSSIDNSCNKKSLINLVENKITNSVKTAKLDNFKTYENLKNKEKKYYFNDTEVVFSFDYNSEVISINYKYDTHCDNHPNFSRFTEGKLNESDVIIQGDYFHDTYLSELNYLQKKVWFNNLEYRTFIRQLAKDSVTHIGKIFCLRQNHIFSDLNMDVYETNNSKNSHYSILIKPIKTDKKNKMKKLLNNISKYLSKKYKVTFQNGSSFRKIYFHQPISSSELRSALVLFKQLNMKSIY